MNRIRICMGIALAAVALVSIPLAYSQQPATPAAPQAPTAPGAPAAQAEKTFSGQLSKVDTAAKTITVKGADQKEMAFSYNDETQVMSPEKTVQGLTGKTGSQLRISYREERGANWASKIELLEKQ